MRCGVSRGCGNTSGFDARSPSTTTGNEDDVEDGDSSEARQSASATRHGHGRRRLSMCFDAADDGRPFHGRLWLHCARCPRQDDNRWQIHLLLESHAALLVPWHPDDLTHRVCATLLHALAAHYVTSSTRHCFSTRGRGSCPTARPQRRALAAAMPLRAGAAALAVLLGTPLERRGVLPVPEPADSSSSGGLDVLAAPGCMRDVRCMRCCRLSSPSSLAGGDFIMAVVLSCRSTCCHS